MIINIGGNEYVSGESYESGDILAAYEQGLRNGKWEAEEKYKLEVKVQPLYHYEKGYDVGHKDGVNFGHTKGYAEGQSNSCKWFKEKSAEIELVANNQGYEEGFDDGFDKGYDTAIKEMLNSEELGETTECMFGAVEDCCEHHSPNKETQEAVQEVLDKDTNEFVGIWVAKDGSGKLKVVNINEGNCDVELIEHVSNSFLCVGDTATISVDDLKEHWNKERAECNYITTEDDQLEKELKLVEKYPHYYKDIRHLNIIDIYRFFDLFEVTDPCLQHSMKKLAVGGKRGAKDYKKDIKEAMDTLKRWEYMQEENKRGLDD